MRPGRPRTVSLCAGRKAAAGRAAVPARPDSRGPHAAAAGPGARGGRPVQVALQAQEL